MQERKVIKFGNSSYVFTLPLEWVKLHNLDENGGINLIETKNSITIMPSLKRLEKKASLNINEKPLKIFNRELISYYLKNYKYIEITGLNIKDNGSIMVNEYMKTSDPDIFAVGDCAQKVCFFTRNNVPILLASTAALEGKIAGYNAFKNKLTRTNKGTINAFSTKIYGRAFSAVGLTEKQCRENDFEIVTGTFSVMDRHPGMLPGANMVNIKLIFSGYSGVVMGAQISGGDSVGEMINVMGVAIQQGMTAADLNTFQVATHPLLTASPIAYPINAAAMNAIEKMI
ncbi:hypothetical protein EOM09_04720 [bacterium]|nr:hypothetical protein [bacterium]